MVSNKCEAERFVQACLYPPKGYRSYGPIRGLIYGGSDYGDHANNEILKLAMIETKESLSEEEIVAKVKIQNDLTKYLKNKSIFKIIYVKDKILNLIVK